MAPSWEKRNLGRRLQPDSLDQNQAVVIAKLADWNPATTSAVTNPVNKNDSHRTTGLHSNERPQHTEETPGLESSCEENIGDHR